MFRNQVVKLLSAFSETFAKSTIFLFFFTA